MARLLLHKPDTGRVLTGEYLEDLIGGIVTVDDQERRAVIDGRVDTVEYGDSFTRSELRTEMLKRALAVLMGRGWILYERRR